MRLWILPIALVLLGTAPLLAWLGSVEGVRTEEVVLDDPAGLMLRGRMFLPKGDGPYPGVLLCHGISNSKENVDPLALALVQRGFAVLTFDFGGHGESAARPLSDKVNNQDARRAMAYLLGRPDVNPQQIGGYGFSMGAIPIVEAARAYPFVRAVVCCGHPVEVTKDSPPNLLEAAGVFDKFVSSAALQDALEQATGQRLEFGELSGSLPDGTARMALLSATTDHPLEPWDPNLLTATVDWLERGLGLTPATPPTPMTWLLPIARAAGILGAMLVLLVGLHTGLGWVSEERSRTALFRRVVSVVGWVICAVPVIVSHVIGQGLLLSDLGLTAVLVLLVINWLLCRHAEPLAVGVPPSWQETPRVLFVPLLAMVGIVALAWLTTTVLYRSPTLWQYPAMVMGVPQLVAEMVAFYPNILLHKLRMVFFGEYSVTVWPSLVWYVALVLEIALPGTVLAVAFDTLETVWRGLQWRRRDPPRPRRPFSWTNTGVRIVLVGAVLIGTILGLLTTRQLDTPSFQKMALSLAEFLCLLVAVLLVLIRLTRLPDQHGGGEATSKVL